MQVGGDGLEVLRSGFDKVHDRNIGYGMPLVVDVSDMELSASAA